MAGAGRTGGSVAVAVAVAALISACGGGEGGEPAVEPVDPPAVTGLTYYEDIKPILDAKCGNCHEDQGLAPFSTGRYEDLEPWGGMIRQAVLDRTMPPWQPDASCNEYLGNRSLSDEQIQAIAEWVDGGMPLGDPAKEGAPLELGSQPSLSRVDLTLPLPVEYTPQGGPDDYRCFVMDWPETEVTYVTGMRARPGERQVVHHVIAFVAEPAEVAEIDALDAADPGPGYSCYGGPGSRLRWLGGWVPGGDGFDTPAGTGVRVEPGSKVIVQMHYNTLTAGPLPDRTEIDLKLDAAVEQEATVQPFTNPTWVDTDLMMIPAMQEDVAHSFAADPTQLFGGAAIEIHDVGMHLHTLGKSARMSIERADGSETCLLDIPRWDFHWQGNYRLAQPVTLSPGDRLKVECRWDNSPPNQPIIDGKPKVPADVTWGEGTNDEMCLGTFYTNPL